MTLRTVARPARPVAALAVGLLLAALAGASDAGQSDRLKALEEELQKDRARAEELEVQTRDLEHEIQVLRAESIAVARRAQDLESALSESEAKLAELERQQASKEADLEERRAQLGGTLAALQRIALRPVEALVVNPGSPIDTVRSALLLRVAVPAIEARARTLNGELEALAELRERIAAERSEMAANGEALELQRGRLTELLQRRVARLAMMSAEHKAARERAARLAAEARDLRDLLDRVEREARERAELAARQQAEQDAQPHSERDPGAVAPSAPSDRTEEASVELALVQPEAPLDGAEPPSDSAGAQMRLARPANVRPFPNGGGALTLPARGSVVLRYGQSRGIGGASKGIAIAARNGAQVVAPFDGQVVYAGIFRSYGQILIIEHDGRYHTLLAGLDRIDAVVGQWVLAGEPLGVLGSSRSGKPELYLELRRAGQPINPLPWLATTGDKVRG